VKFLLVLEGREEPVDQGVVQGAAVGPRAATDLVAHKELLVGGVLVMATPDLHGMDSRQVLALKAEQRMSQATWCRPSLRTEARRAW
jgi:hypothetical protein